MAMQFSFELCIDLEVYSIRQSQLKVPSRPKLQPDAKDWLAGLALQKEGVPSDN